MMKRIGESVVETAIWVAQKQAQPASRSVPYLLLRIVEARLASQII